MENRDYQIQGISDSAELVSTKRKIIRQLPTGGGKTVEFAYLTQRYYRSTGKSVLILVHREELMYQAQKTIKQICDVDAILITSQSKHYSVSRVYIGMVESLVSRLDLFSNVGLVIVDEAHIANFNKIHNIFLEELIIGYTATPISSNKKMPMNRFFNDIVVGPQIGELIDRGFLAQNWTRSPKDVVDVTKFEIDRLKGDYNERQMATEYKLPRFITNVVTKYNQYCKGEKTIVFNVTIEHSKQVAECLTFCGYNARHLASDNEHERHEILKWFHDTEDAILCNVMMFTVGFDEPTVRNIITNFATLSITKFLQCCGRGARPIDQEWIDKHQVEYPYPIKLKSHFNIIDLGANHVRFADWSWERDWADMFHNPHIPGNGIAPVKTCPECEGLVHAAVRVCTCMNYKGEPCLYEFEKKPRPAETKMEEMILVTKGISLTDIAIRAKKKDTYYTFSELGESVVKNMYRTNKNPSETIKQRHFIVYYSLCVSWYNKNLAGADGNLDDITNSAWHIRKALNIFNDNIRRQGGMKMIDQFEYPLEVDQDLPLLVSRKFIGNPEENVYEW